ncbi:MAG: glycosyltransferase family 4 protein [Solobacterium sp.]|nr:glycosyltransferase family 4 protein [Solobacterium sp.]
MKKKICFVIQRYGKEVNGGAELLCREMAEHLSRYYDVSVMTSRAKDYITWKNEYTANEEVINGIRVYRFSAVQERDRKKTDPLNAVFRKEVCGNEAKETEWLIAQGPYCPDLAEALKREKDSYDAFIFFTYLYWTTVAGLPEVADKAILVPTAHDEQYIFMKSLQKIFRECAGIIYLTEAERRLCERIFHNGDVPHVVGGCGIEVPAVTDAEGTREKYDLGNYITYVGRVDEGKLVPVLVKYFEEYKKRNASDLKLVLCGRESIKLKKSEHIVSLGFVPEQEKYDVMAGALCLVLPSRFESLSMVVLESMALGVPAVVNAACEVTRDHCVLSNGGLYYRDYFEFEGILNRLQERPEERKMIGLAGQKYVSERYSWDTVLKQIRELIEGHV